MMSLRNAPGDDACSRSIVFLVPERPDSAAGAALLRGWGEFVHSFSGVLEIKTGAQNLIAPPMYGVWLPPGLDRKQLEHTDAGLCCVYMAPRFAGALPRSVCTLRLGPLARALLNHLRVHHAKEAGSPEAVRLLRVLHDQLATAVCEGSYLPRPTNSMLCAVLQGLEQRPDDGRTLAEMAAAFDTTERTLSRHCQRELGMTFMEWRQRLRVVSALPRLQAGQTVERIAQDTGYGSASAFIAMFRRMTGATPDDFRGA